MGVFGSWVGYADSSVLHLGEGGYHCDVRGGVSVACGVFRSHGGDRVYVGGLAYRGS